MSGVSRTGVDRNAGTTGTPAGKDDASAEVRAADDPRAPVFAEVVRSKGQQNPGGKPLKGAPAGTGDRIEASRDDAAGFPLRAAGKGARDEASLLPREGDAAGLLFAGDFRHPRPEEAAASAAAPEVGGGAEAAARIEEIASRIVAALEVATGPRGAAEVRLELSLGAIGHLRVAVTKGEDGQVRLGIESPSERAALLVRSRIGDLQSALETRGISLQETTVRGPEGPAFRYGVAAANPPAGPSGEDAASRQGARDQDQDDRRRPSWSDRDDEDR